MNKLRCVHPRHYVDKQEKLSRFVTDFEYIKNGNINQSVFKADKSNTLSVYRTTRCKPKYIWYLCETYFNAQAVGRVEILAADILEKGLDFNPDGKPHTRHANIIKWNTNKPDDLRIRQELARVSKIFRRPE